MARVRSSGPVCLLLVLACSSTYVAARDQVDLASLPAEVGKQRAGNPLSDLISITTRLPGSAGAIGIIQIASR